MSEQVSTALIKLINEVSDLESTISKIDAAIFVRSCDKIINEKVSYLYNLLQAEGKNYNQNTDNNYDSIKQILAHYKQKLNMVYDEFYCQYVNIQNEIQEARVNQKIAMMNYQKLINDKENQMQSKEYKDFLKQKEGFVQKLQLANGKKEYDEIYKKLMNLKSPIKNIDELKKELRDKNELYETIIDMCNQKFGICRANFEKRINDNFLIVSSMQVVSDNNIFEKIKNRIINIFIGNKKYVESLKEYNDKVDKIDARVIVDEMRDVTVDFIADILELREYWGNLKKVV